MGLVSDIVGTVTSFGLNKLFGGGGSGKEAEHQADIARQTAETRSIGQSFLQQIASADPNAPELPGFVDFVNRKIQETQLPGDQQGAVRREGTRILGVVEHRAEENKFTAQLENLGENFSMAIQELAASLAGARGDIASAQEQATRAISFAQQRSDEPQSIAPVVIAGLVGVGAILVLRKKRG